MSVEDSNKYITRYEPIDGMDVFYDAMEGTFTVGNLVLTRVTVYEQDEYSFFKLSIDGRIIPIHFLHKDGSRDYLLKDIESPIFPGLGDSRGPKVNGIVYQGSEDKENVLRKIEFILNIWAEKSKNYFVIDSNI
jgi:hypothetical protein